MDSEPGVNLQKRATVVVGLFLGLHVLWAVWDPVPLWGVNQLAYLPSPAGFVFAALAVCLLVPGVRKPMADTVSRACRALSPWEDGWRRHLGHAAIVVGGLLAFATFRTAVPLLGDGQMLLLELDDLWGIQRLDRAPLAYRLIRWMDGYGRSVWGSPQATYQVFSYASGVLYLGLAVPAIRALARGSQERTVLLGFLVTAGFVQLFFGYVENYAILLPGMLVYLTAGHLAVRKRLPTALPALVLGALIPLHFSMVSLIPSLMVLPFLKSGAPTQRRMRGKRAGEAALLSALAAAVALLILRLLDFDITSPVGRLQTSPFLPLAIRAGPEHHYGMFSPTHFLDLANQFLLAAPAALLVIAVFGSRCFTGGRTRTFALVCSVFPVLATVVANPTIGAFRDWDVAAFSALPLTVWAATVLVKQAGSAERMRRVAFQICVAAALHTAVWVGVNADPQWSEARYADLLERCRLAGHARSAGWETLGGHRHAEGRLRAAAAAYEKVLEAEPTYAPAYYNLGNIYRELRADARAIYNYRKAIELDPDLADAHLNLAGTYFDHGEMARARAHYEKAAALEPRSFDAYWGLGNTHFGLGNYVAAITSYEQVIALNPSFVEAYRRAGDACYQLGRYGQSIDYYVASLRLEPGYAAAHSNIGNNYFALGNYQKAIDYYREAVRLDPGFVDAYYNMGSAYHALGKPEETRRAFVRVLELAPRYPQAPMLRQWLGRNP